MHKREDSDILCKRPFLLLKHWMCSDLFTGLYMYFSIYSIFIVPFTSSILIVVFHGLQNKELHVGTGGIIKIYLCCEVPFHLAECHLASSEPWLLSLEPPVNPNVSSQNGCCGKVLPTIYVLKTQKTHYHSKDRQVSILLLALCSALHGLKEVLAWLQTPFPASLSN